MNVLICRCKCEIGMGPRFTDEGPECHVSVAERSRPPEKDPIANTGSAQHSCPYCSNQGTNQDHEPTPILAADREMQVLGLRRARRPGHSSHECANCQRENSDQKK